MDKIPLSARAYTRILKWARTIPDLAGSLSIESPLVPEAVSHTSSGAECGVKWFRRI